MRRYSLRRQSCWSGTQESLGGSQHLDGLVSSDLQLTYRCMQIGSVWEGAQEGK